VPTFSSVWLSSQGQAEFSNPYVAWRAAPFYTTSTKRRVAVERLGGSRTQPDGAVDGAPRLVLGCGLVTASVPPGKTGEAALVRIVRSRLPAPAGPEELA
jgi:hypothetical protein